MHLSDKGNNLFFEDLQQRLHSAPGLMEGGSQDRMAQGVEWGSTGASGWAFSCRPSGLGGGSKQFANWPNC